MVVAKEHRHLVNLNRLVQGHQPSIRQLTRRTGQETFDYFFFIRCFVPILVVHELRQKLIVGHIFDRGRRGRVLVVQQPPVVDGYTEGVENIEFLRELKFIRSAEVNIDVLRVYNNT